MAFLQFIICVATLGCSSLVAFSRNPLNSIIFLIATFVLTTIVLLLFSIDFLSLIFIIVYVGAIAVLFLFVCMMVALKSKQENFFNFQALRKMLERVYALFFSFFIFILGFSSVFSHEDFFFDRHVIYVDHQEGIFIFGQALFNYFNISFLIAGLILLVALLGAVVLTHRFISFFRQINFSRQLSASSLGGVIGYGDSQLLLSIFHFSVQCLIYLFFICGLYVSTGEFDNFKRVWIDL